MSASGDTEANVDAAIMLYGTWSCIDHPRQLVSPLGADGLVSPYLRSAFAPTDWFSISLVTVLALVIIALSIGTMRLQAAQRNPRLAAASGFIVLLISIGVAVYGGSNYYASVVLGALAAYRGASFARTRATGATSR